MTSIAKRKRAEVTTEAPGVPARLWDAPVRIIHWLLVGLIGFSWWASDDHLDWHRWSGYTILGLVVFRLYWGFAGGGAARFRQIVKGPRATLAYLATLKDRAPSTTAGHNPLGALSILAILGLLVTQISTGLFAVDIDGFESGPMSYLVSFETGRVFAELHELSFRGIQAMVVLHVAAVVFYLVWKRTNLIGAMFTGRRRLPVDPGFRTAPLWRLALGVLAAGALAWFVSKGMRV